MSKSLTKGVSLPSHIKTAISKCLLNERWPNWSFNADANTGHGFAILLASVGALRASRSGAG
jgi:hypothetical protein